MVSFLKKTFSLLSRKFGLSRSDWFQPISDEEKVIIAKQVEECKVTHDVSVSSDVTYFDLAESGIEWQWETLIYPNIKDFNFDICLELAPGHGRNTEKLKQYAKQIHLVDVNESCIEACRSRFGNAEGNCQFFYYVNSGYSLEEIGDATMTCIYSWDAVVHFDKLVVRSYVREFARILQSGGYGFIHHSNYGEINPSSEWMNNPGWRSNMTAKLFLEYCNDVGLKVVKQEIIGQERDCITIFYKP